jgi:tetratricopeptide (TPR) repeat protein
LGALVGAGLTALVALAAVPAQAPRPTAVATIAEGRRLAREGKLADAAAKLEQGWQASRDPEVLFDLAVCYERLGQDAKAVSAFRSYLDLPLALRLRAAEDHLRALAAQGGAASPAAPSGPRRVLVPAGADSARCFQDCTGPSSCRPRFGDRWGHACTTTQFICLEACPGARVEPGLCATATLRPGERCRTERGVL